MKKIFTTLFITILSVLSLSSVSAQINSIDKSEIRHLTDNIAKSISNNNPEFILQSISPNAPTTLKNEIIDFFDQQNVLFFIQKIDKYSQLNDHQIKIDCTISGSGLNWIVENKPAYYIFEKNDNGWYLIESDFYQQLKANNSILSYLFQFIISIIISLAIIAILSIFWFWMLIDCIKKNVEDKAMWITVLILFNFLGSIIYYLVVKKQIFINKTKGAGNGK
jgi:hypothetical protein